MDVEAHPRVTTAVPAIGARLATAAGGGAIALWAFLALLSRLAGAVPPLELTALGFALSGVTGLALLAARGRLRALRQPPQVWLHGVGGLFGYHACYFTALAWAPAAEANLLNYSWPLLLVLFSALLPGGGLRAAHLLGVALGAAGCLLLLGNAAHLSPRFAAGYLAAVAAAVIWAGYSVLARRFRAVPPGAVAGFCVATALLAAVAHLATEHTVAPSAGAWLAIAALGFGPMGAAFFLWDIGMKRGDPRLLGTLAYATPVASTLLLAAGGYADLSATTLLAAALVAVGGLIAARG